MCSDSILSPKGYTEGESYLGITFLFPLRGCEHCLCLGAVSSVLLPASGGLEPPTSSLISKRSNQLSYEPDSRCFFCEQQDSNPCISHVHFRGALPIKLYSHIWRLITLNRRSALKGGNILTIKRICFSYDFPSDVVRNLVIIIELSVCAV